MFVERSVSGAAVFWLTLFGLVLAAWVAIYAMAVPAELRAASQVFGAEFWRAFCTVTLDAAGFGRLVAMWALMSTAMMLPTVIPTLLAYGELGSTGAQTKPAHLIAGFLVVWWGFSVAAALLQMALFRVDLISAFGDSRAPVLSAVLLASAGAYQFTALKNRCARKCRAPVSFFMQHWEAGVFAMGLRLGAVCLGCCWALMLLAFVGGVMNLAFMGLATVIMVIEKLPDIGRWIGRPLGAVLLTASAIVLATGI